MESRAWNDSNPVRFFRQLSCRWIPFVVGVCIWVCPGLVFSQPDLAEVVMFSHERQPGTIRSNLSFDPNKPMAHVGLSVHFFHSETGKALVSPRELKRLAELGIRYVRTDLLWNQVEKQPGVFDFHQYDLLLEQLTIHRLRPVFILGVGNNYHFRPSSPLELKEARYRYAKAVVDHFKGRHIIWELSNEPDHEGFWFPRPDPTDYMVMIQDLLPQLRALDPTGSYIAPSTSGVPKGFLETCFQHGLLDWVDAVSVHPYQSFYKKPPKNRPPEHIQANHQQNDNLPIRQLREMIQTYAPLDKTIPVVLTEWGYSTAPGEIDETLQAWYTVRQALLGCLYQFPVNVFHTWTYTIRGLEGFHEATETKEYEFGFIRPDGTLKPVYYAMQDMFSRLGHLIYMGALYEADGDYILWFSSADHQENTVVGWTQNSPHKVTLLGDTYSFLLTGKPTYRSLPHTETPRLLKGLKPLK